MISGNAFAIEQAPPDAGAKPQLTIRMFSAQEGSIYEVSTLSTGFTSFISACMPVPDVLVRYTLIPAMDSVAVIFEICSPAAGCVPDCRELMT